MVVNTWRQPVRCPEYEFALPEVILVDSWLIN